MDIFKTSCLWLAISLGALVLQAGGVAMDIVIGNKILNPDGFRRR
jgi:hypothetical protein